MSNFLELINTQYLLLGVWTSQSGGLWSRFTLPEHRGQKTRTGKTIEPNSIEEQGSASLRCLLPSQGLRSFVDCTPFLAYNHKEILPNLPPTGSWAVDISTGHGTSHHAVLTLLLRTFPSSTLNRSAAQFLFAFPLVYTTHPVRYRSFLWSQNCHQGSQLLYHALSVLRNSSHPLCKHGGKLSDCPPAFTPNSAGNSQSRDGLLQGLPTTRRRVWHLW